MNNLNNLNDSNTSGKAKIIFCKSDSIIGFIVRKFTRSNWDHAAIQIGNSSYEAVPGFGVISHRGEYTQNDGFIKTEIIEVDVPNIEKCRHFLIEQLNKPYDWKAVFAWPLRLNWHDRSKWFCSELVAESLIDGGVQGINKKVRRIDPKKLYNILKRIR